LALSLSCVATFFFALYFIPETKGKSNEECVALFQNVPIKSEPFSPKYQSINRKKANPEDDEDI
jgi:hypothetical protein